jgi:hypothetical protein
MIQINETGKPYKEIIFIFRQPSVGSRSLRDVAVPEEAEEAKEPTEAATKDDAVEQGRGTPEVVMFATAPEPVKPEEAVLPPKKISLPKIR